jgi:hypothetical protein
MVRHDALEAMDQTSVAAAGVSRPVLSINFWPRMRYDFKVLFLGRSPNNSIFLKKASDRKEGAACRRNIGGNQKAEKWQPKNKKLKIINPTPLHPS